MNNADNFPVDIEEQRSWLLAEKASRACSWPEIAKLVGVPHGTLSAFGTTNYAGDNAKLARAVFRWRQLLASQADRLEGLIADPGYFDTPTSRRITGLLTIAQMGRITVGATGPGTGKDMAANEYAASVSNVWIATMWPTDKKMAAMIEKVLRALDVKPKGWTRHMSHQVVEQVQGKRGLLVINEANHLEAEAIEEIRAWHDATRVGVCLLGNEELLMRIEGGAKRDAYARLNSRIAQRLIQTLPQPGDVAAFCDGWGLADVGMRDFLTRIALTPGAGGLRECRQIVEQASLLAADDDRPLAFSDLKDAQSTRATRSIRA
ncbi:AAA family ATPase [Sphingomonas sp.]|uniref:AAA family ATPase n=1 Tax=Sphingomonas sp. TaxID=28214 RepID=UPI003CC6449B